MKQQKKNDVLFVPRSKGFREELRRIRRRSLKDWFKVAVDFVIELYYNAVLRLQYPETCKIIRRIRRTQAVYAGSYKYVHLHRLLADFQPKSILEFGSGSSTGVFAVYARQIGARVRTVEDSEAWQDNTKKALGEKASRVEFVLAPSTGKTGAPSRCYYRYDPTQAFDLVYVDGPPLVINGQRDKSAVNWNIVDIIRAGFGPKLIVIDGRMATARYIATEFIDDYLPYLREVGRQFPAYRYHSYFVRRGG